MPHLFVSAARDILVSSTEAVQVTLADAIVLRHRISLHKACPLRDMLGRGGTGRRGREERGESLLPERGKENLRDPK